MKKLPITLIIDDPSPIVSVYYSHAAKRTTADGRPLIKHYPTSFLKDFCDVIEKRGIMGKFSIVPAPGNYGDIVNGIEGISMDEMHEWLEIAKSRVAPQFDIGPEMLTHNKAVDLATGKALEMRECDWATTQNFETLTPYISKALSILKEAGFECTGVTSPWDFGIQVEEEYVRAISQAMFDVYGKKNAWYFLHVLRNNPNIKPWVAYDDGDRCVVSIPSATDDVFWQTINCASTDDEYVSSVADQLITADGKRGQLIETLETGGYPMFHTHWQSLCSNGLFTGLRALDEVGKRINEHLSDRVEWMKVSDVMQLVLSDKAAYPKR
ncbi:MAG: hypothetical protein E7656_03810 [Ruminococcaceae bacterium]|nr:hypothetical protein [Oscillospiraceae bacterium]